MIMTEWQSHYLSTMTYYNIDRWDDYFGWIENYDQASESPYIDTDVGVNHRNYLYKVSYADVCGNEGPNSGLGKNILLEGVQYTSHYYLSWNAYIDWDGGVSQYIIQYYNQLIGAYEDMTTVSGTTLNYTDTELTKDGVDTSYCYRVIAVSAANPGIRSYSNARCFTPGPRDYFPNAFSPNDDGINEVYKYHGQFAKDLKVEIYSRWGALVYSSDQVTFEWDGRNQQNGKSCAQGTYIFRYEMRGYDGTLIKDEMVIFLLR
jgi:gliding motility-associated-like protein